MVSGSTFRLFLLPSVYIPQDTNGMKCLYSRQTHPNKAESTSDTSAAAVVGCRGRGRLTHRRTDYTHAQQAHHYHPHARTPNAHLHVGAAERRNALLMVSCLYLHIS